MRASGATVTDSHATTREVAWPGTGCPLDHGLARRRPGPASGASDWRTMSSTRLTSLDASFLEVESSTAHMHVGWAALFAPSAGGERPSFTELRDHVERRLDRAPR